MKKYDLEHVSYYKLDTMLLCKKEKKLLSYKYKHVLLIDFTDKIIWIYDKNLMDDVIDFACKFEYDTIIKEYKE